MSVPSPSKSASETSEPLVYRSVRLPTDFSKSNSFSDRCLSVAKAKVLRRIAFVNLILAVCILLVGSACVGVGFHLVYKCHLFVKCPGKTGSEMNCPAGSGIWMGGIAIATSIIGIVATRKDADNRTLLVAYQAASVFCSLLLWVLIGISAVFTGVFTSYMNNYWFGSNYNVQPFWYDLILSSVIFDLSLVGLAALYTSLYLWCIRCYEQRGTQKREYTKDSPITT